MNTRINLTWKSAFLLVVITAAIILACKKDKTYCWKCHDNLGNLTLDVCNKTKQDIKNMVACDGVSPAPDSCIDKACTKQ